MSPRERAVDRIDQALRRYRVTSELLIPEAAVRAAWVELAPQGHTIDLAAAVAARLDVSPSAMGGGCSISDGGRETRRGDGVEP